VGLSLLSGVGRQLVSEMGEGEMGREGMVAQKCRGMERSTKRESRFTSDN